MSSAAAADNGAAELDVLYPEREATIAGRRITMREYGFVEGLKLAGRLAPLVERFVAIAATPDDATALQALQTTLGTDVDATAALIAQACDQPAKWVQTLSDADGQQLLSLWWLVNSGFFARRVAYAVQLKAARLGLDGARSTPGSSPTATTRAPSAATPRGRSGSTTAKP